MRQRDNYTDEARKKRELHWGNELPGTPSLVRLLRVIGSLGSLEGLYLLCVLSLLCPKDKRLPVTDKRGFSGNLGREKHAPKRILRKNHFGHLHAI